MADWQFQRAESGRNSWSPRPVRRGLQRPKPLRPPQREDGRRSPGEVLSWVSGMRFHAKDLERAFFSERFTRVLDALGYATLMRWRSTGGGLAGKEADLWLLENTLTLEHAGETLSAYEVAPTERVPDDAEQAGGLPR